MRHGLLKVNTEQRAIIILAVALFIISELFPPWRYEYQYVQEFKHLCPAGFSFIAHPPAVRPYDEMLRLCGVSDVPSPEQISTHIDLWRLNCQRLILLLLGGGLFLNLHSPSSRIKSVISGILLTLGTIVSGLYILIVLVGY